MLLIKALLVFGLHELQVPENGQVELRACALARQIQQSLIPCCKVLMISFETTE